MLYNVTLAWHNTLSTKRGKELLLNQSLSRSLPNNYCHEPSAAHRAA